MDGRLLPVGSSGAPGIVLSAKCSLHSGGSIVKALSLACDSEHRAGNLFPIPAVVNGEFLAECVGLAVLNVEALIEVHALNELLGGSTCINSLKVVSVMVVVACPSTSESDLISNPTSTARVANV